MTERLLEQLLVDLGADGRVQVRSLSAGERFARPAGEPVELLWPLAEEDLADLRWYLERYLRLPTAVYGERGARVAAALPRWGEAVFGAVFGEGPARDAYVTARTRARARGGAVEIAFLSRSAQQLGRPWELMAAPERGVPLVLDGVALTRTLQSGGMAEVFDVPGTRLRVLMVISRPAGSADVGYRMIARPLLRRLEAVRGSVELVVLRPPTLERLRDVLAEAQAAGEPFQVVHFDGHGVFGTVAAGGGGGLASSVMYAAPGEQGMLAFEKPGGGSDLVGAGRVAQVLAGAKVPLVVLNACQSAQVGTEVEAAVATRLLAEGCANVVAMAYSVYAVAAAEFMTAFYERLFAGDRVTDAVTAGRAQLVLNNERPSLKGMLPLADWMVPVLYTRSEARFPGLHTTRGPGEAVGDVLTRIRAGAEPDRSQDLEPVGDFVGRDADFHALDTAARLQHVVVVHGPGGTGKTELAKAFGRWWRDTGGVDDPDWVVWHSFEPGLASFGLDGVITGIGLRVFGTRFAVLDAAARQAAVEELLATRRLLLVWDNFESVREMPDPGRATPPLPGPEQERMRAFLTRIAGGSRSAVVITSRTPESWLGPAVRRIPLGGLNGDDATTYAQQLLAPYPDAQPHRQSAVLGDLMQWLDGHPLSMKLILPRLATSTARQLLDGLKGITALPEDDATGDRRTSLAASVAYSFRHLGADDQQALTILSLVHGVAFATTLAVCSQQPEAPERFRHLAPEEWARLLERAAGLGLLTPLGTGMFRLHPALPAHLTTHWRTGAGAGYTEERTAATRALVTAYADFGNWLSGEIQAADAPTALLLMDSQARMLGAVLGHALDHRQWEHGQRILQPLDVYWQARGLEAEARSWADRVRLAVETPGGTPPGLGTPAGDLWLYMTGAQASRELDAGRLDRAERTYRSLLHTLRQQPDSPGQGRKFAVVYHQLGRIAQDRARLDEAEDWYRKALAIDEVSDYLPGMAGSYHQLGMVAQDQGRLEEAEDWYRKSLTIEEELGNRPGMAGSYHQLGTLTHDRERLEEAEDWYRRSLTIRVSLGDRPGMASSYHQLGLLAQDRGRLEEAEDWYRRSLTIEEELGNRPGMAITYYQLGGVARARGRFEEAGSWYRRAFSLKEALGDRVGMAGTYHQLGLVAQAGGRLEEAEDWYRRSLTISEDLENRPGLAVTYGQFGLLAEQRGDTAQALTWVARCVALFEEFPHPSTGPGPAHLRRLTARLGLPALETAWRAVTGEPLPDTVRVYVLTGPDATDGHQESTA